MMGSVGQILAMTGHEKDLRNVIASGAIINAVLAVYLVQRYGLNGVAWSVALSGTYAALAASVLVKLRLKISVHMFCGLSKEIAS
jgi:O-antigen/teichoic acid export membrane protein